MIARYHCHQQKHAQEDSRVADEERETEMIRYVRIRIEIESMGGREKGRSDFESERVRVATTDLSLIYTRFEKQFRKEGSKVWEILGVESRGEVRT